MAIPKKIVAGNITPENYSMLLVVLLKALLDHCEQHNLDPKAIKERISNELLLHTAHTMATFDVRVDTRLFRLHAKRQGERFIDAAIKLHKAMQKELQKMHKKGDAHGKEDIPKPEANG